MTSTSLLSSQNYVESPFIIAKIGNYTFGQAGASTLQGMKSVTYPNFMKSLNIVKIDGTINTYTLQMVYQIRAGDDPNLLERVFSSVADNWRIYLSYGDYNMPTNLYMDEEALITGIDSNVDVVNSRITYVIRCTGAENSLKGTTYNFGGRVAKPSDVIKSLFANSQYGLSKVFSGVTRGNINKYIAGDDAPVQIEPQTNMNVIDYMSYLVNCMTPYSNKGDSKLKGANYHLVFNNNKSSSTNGGATLQVVKIERLPSGNVPVGAYELDVGYPNDNFVTNFSVRNSQDYSILYNTDAKVKQSEYVYKIGNNGEIGQFYAPSIIRSPSLYETSQEDRTWWTRMTEFPITVSVTIKGLLRPSLLMSYVKLNVLFFGQKHISSGLYVITQQEDNINANGYRTTLTLLRVDTD